MESQGIPISLEKREAIISEWKEKRWFWIQAKVEAMVRHIPKRLVDIKTGETYKIIYPPEAQQLMDEIDEIIQEIDNDLKRDLGE